MLKNMIDYAEYIENNLISGPWVLGDNYFICDLTLFFLLFFRDDMLIWPLFKKDKNHNIKFHERQT